MSARFIYIYMYMSAR